MNTGELRSLFIDLLNRNDLTVTLADRFISMGISRVERTLRTPFQRQTALYVIEEDDPPYITIPEDYLGLYWLKVNGKSVDRVSAATGEGFVTPDKTFYYENEKIHFNPALVEDDEVSLNYYAAMPEPDEDSDVTPQSAIIPDLILYCAMIYAADFYVDERKASFEATFAQLMSEAQAMSDRDELTQAVISNPYEGMC